MSKIIYTRANQNENRDFTVNYNSRGIYFINGSVMAIYFYISLEKYIHDPSAEAGNGMTTDQQCRPLKQIYGFS